MDYVMKHQFGDVHHPTDASSKVLNVIIPVAVLAKPSPSNWMGIRHFTEHSPIQLIIRSKRVK
jgi:hypothetical protein